MQRLGRQTGSTCVCGQREGGFTLLVVVWSLALLSLIGTHITSTGRAEAQLAAHLRASAVAEAAADGILHEAIFHLLQSPPRAWQPDGIARERTLLGGARAVVRAESERGKLSPNLATARQFQALLMHLGVAPVTASALASAILDWRTAGLQPRPNGAKDAEYRAAGRDYAPAGQPFENLDEVGLVLGMTPGLLARLTPLLSIYQDTESDLRIAAPVIAQAMRDADSVAWDAMAAPDSDAVPVVLITATAVLPHGTGFTRQAHVRLGPGLRGRVYQILTWRALTD